MRHSEQCAELVEFKKRLGAMGVPWRPQNDFKVGIFRVKGTMQGNGRVAKFSVIWGNGTYGEEEGLLEVMVNGCEPEGRLTAEEAVNVIETYLYGIEHRHVL